METDTMGDPAGRSSLCGETVGLIYNNKQNYLWEVFLT